MQRFVLGIAICSGWLATVSCVDVDNDENAVDWESPDGGKADVFGIAEGSPEARGILRLVNEADYKTLRNGVQIAHRAAKSIIEKRKGPDGIAGNTDDFFRSLRQLDKAPYVGRTELEKLLTYARAHGYVQTNPGPGPGPLTYEQLPTCTQANLAAPTRLREEEVGRFFQLDREERNAYVDRLETVELAGSLEMRPLRYADERLNTHAPMVNGTFVFPVAMVNAYSNFFGLTYEDPSKILPIRFRDVKPGTQVKIRGKRSFLATKFGGPMDCRVLGAAVLATEVVLNGTVIALTDKFDGPKPATATSSVASDLFYVLGQDERVYNPLVGSMAKGIRNVLRDPVQQRRLLTAYLYGPKSSSGIPQVGIAAHPAPGNPWDPNWSFRFETIKFGVSHSGEFYDGLLEHLESGYLADFREAHWDIAVGMYAPWADAQDILDVQDHLGHALSRSQMEERLAALGGPVPEMRE
jgi:hypothetical protein